MSLNILAMPDGTDWGKFPWSSHNNSRKYFVFAINKIINSTEDIWSLLRGSRRKLRINPPPIIWNIFRVFTFCRSRTIRDNARLVVYPVTLKIKIFTRDERGCDRLPKSLSFRWQEQQSCSCDKNHFSPRGDNHILSVKQLIEFYPLWEDRSFRYIDRRCRNYCKFHVGKRCFQQDWGGTGNMKYIYIIIERFILESTPRSGGSRPSSTWASRLTHL